jgi:hypothetical protein
LNVIEVISDYRNHINFNWLIKVEAFFDLGVTAGESPFGKHETSYLNSTTERIDNKVSNFQLKLIDLPKAWNKIFFV